MTITSDAPADTTMMRIVHDALRRDLARASATLARPERASAGAAAGDRRAPHVDDALPSCPPCLRGRRPVPAGPGASRCGSRDGRCARPHGPPARSDRAGDGGGGDSRDGARRGRLGRRDATDRGRARRARRRAPPAPARGGGRRHAHHRSADHRGRVAGDREAAQPRPEVDVRARVRGSLAHRQRQRRRPRHRDRARATRPAVHPAARLRTAISATRGGVLDARRQAGAPRAAGEQRGRDGRGGHRRRLGCRP